MLNQLTQDEGPCKSDLCLVYCTCPDSKSADQIALALVEQSLAACVNRIPGVVSTYRWQGHVEQASEHLLMIKTSVAQFDALSRAILELHPYELPEIIAVPIQQGFEPYLKWIHTCLIPES